MISYISNEPSNIVSLVLRESDNQSISNDVLIRTNFESSNIKFEIKVNEGFTNNQILESDRLEHSAINYKIDLKRKSGFFNINYFVPSLFFIFACYVSFWIDKNAVPARVTLPITLILAVISLLNNATFDIPSLSYNPWITEYFLGVYLLLSLAGIEYAVLSFCN